MQAPAAMTGPVLITGGAGFIGFNLVQHVVAETQARVVVIDKLTYAAHATAADRLRAIDRVTFVHGDIGDTPLVASLFEQHQPVAILNLAAETHVDRSIDGPSPFIQTNVNGTFALLEAARRYVGSLDPSRREGFRFLHVSTDEVYGTLGTDGRFSEMTPYAPNSPYAASKAAADHLVRAYYHTYRLPTLITNCSNNYGPFQHCEKLIPLTVLNALDGRVLPIYGDGGNVRDWLHVSDHCGALVSVLRRGRPGTTYNIGADNEQTNLSIVDRICATLENLRPASANPKLRAAGAGQYSDLKRLVQDRPGHDRRYAVDATRLRTELGWTPRYDFDAGLRDTAQWYIDHGSWYEAARIGYDRERLGLGA